MHHASRDRHLAGRRAVRGAVLLTIAALLLGSCSTPESPSRSTAPPDATGSATTGDAAGRVGSPAREPDPADIRRGLPTIPATRNASTLAGQLDRATATLRDRSATAPAVRRAGEFQQAAVHALVGGPGAFRRQVLTRMRPGTVVVTRGSVRAARLLRSMTTPERALPDWRIVTPPSPGRLRRHYAYAQRRTDIPWAYLAAIHLVETRMGRIRGTSTAGARGPMQFLPSTWDLYGAGGDITDPRDAVMAAARLLQNHGAPDDMAEALWHYNPSDSYVRAVTAHARTMQRAPYAYRGYWHWRVLYRHTRGTYVLPVGYPQEGPVLLPGR